MSVEQGEIEHCDGRVQRTLASLEESLEKAKQSLQQVKDFLSSPPSDVAAVLCADAALNPPTKEAKDCLGGIAETIGGMLTEAGYGLCPAGKVPFIPASCRSGVEGSDCYRLWRGHRPPGAS